MNSRRPLMCRRFMPSGDAPNGEKAQTLQRDLGCPASAQKIFRFAFEANQLPLRCVLFRKRGTLAIVTNVGTGRGGRKATSSRVFARGTNGEASVRRSRVVLTPRRWRQVLKKLTLLRDDGDNKARSPGKSSKETVKPSRRECRLIPVNLWRLPVHFLHQPRVTSDTRHSPRLSFRRSRPRPPFFRAERN
jgi:hypothetical protein